MKWGEVLTVDKGTQRGQIYFSSHALSESCRRLARLRKIDLTPFSAYLAFGFRLSAFGEPE